MNKWIKDIISRDPCVYEDAYWGKRPPVSEVMPIIIDMLHDTTDAFTMGKLLELIGESQDIKNLNVLDLYIQHSNKYVAEWATVSRQALLNNELWQKNIYNAAQQGDAPEPPAAAR